MWGGGGGGGGGEGVRGGVGGLVAEVEGRAVWRVMAVELLFVCSSVFVRVYMCISLSLTKPLHLRYTPRSGGKE